MRATIFKNYTERVLTSREFKTNLTFKPTKKEIWMQKRICYLKPSIILKKNLFFFQTPRIKPLKI
jgi:hypothetical protein